MQNISPTDKHTLSLGQIVSNLQSLEILLRVFLHNVDKKRYGNTPPKIDLNKITVREELPEQYFTNYDSLGDLIETYNELVAGLGATQLSIDKTIITLRDALAHGRVLSKNPEPPFQLYKFGKPRNGKVCVIEILDLTDARLKEEIRRVFGELMKVKNACERFCPKAVG